MPRIGVFRLETAKAIERDFRQRQGQPMTRTHVDAQGASVANGLQLHYAKLTSSLSAASAFLTGDTTCTADLVKRADADDLEAGDISITITNRWVDLALDSGKYVIVANILNEWVIVASECP